MGLWRRAQPVHWTVRRSGQRRALPSRLALALLAVGAGLLLSVAVRAARAQDEPPISGQPVVPVATAIVSVRDLAQQPQPAPGPDEEYIVIPFQSLPEEP